jgi:hypothetical protein
MKTIMIALFSTLTISQAHAWSWKELKSKFIKPDAGSSVCKVLTKANNADDLLADVVKETRCFTKSVDAEGSVIAVTDSVTSIYANGAIEMSTKVTPVTKTTEVAKN